MCPHHALVFVFIIFPLIFFSQCFFFFFNSICKILQENCNELLDWTQEQMSFTLLETNLISIEFRQINLTKEAGSLNCI